MYSFGTRSKESLQGIAPDLVRVMEAAIVDSPIDFTITDGVRTTAQQQVLYQKGRDASGHIINRADVVTMDDGVHRRSNHQVHADGFGHAVDLYPYVNDAVDYNDNANRLKTISDHIKAVATGLEIPITWGGDWTLEKDGIVDRPHFQLKI